MVRPDRRALLGAAPLLAMPAIARADQTRRWRMVTSWTRNLPGPGTTAARLAQRITAMSGGRLTIDLFAADEIVPGLGAFEAVSTGAVEMAHTASLFWEGKLPGASLFTTAPFGMTPSEHQTWIVERGGQALWDELYRPSGLRAFLAGNTGQSMGGWFKKPIVTLADVQGLRIRSTGIGAEVWSAMGATPIVVAPAFTGDALERGTIDAVELLAPANDAPSGLGRFAPFYHIPGFNKPNGASEALFSLRALEALPGDLQGMIETACTAEHSLALCEANALNAEAFHALFDEGVHIIPFGDQVLAAARDDAKSVLDQKALASPIAGRIVASYRSALAAGRNWAKVQAYMTQVLGA